MKNSPAARRVVILGAQSAIAEATARLFAADGARLVIVGRDQGRLNEIADDLVVRGAAQVHTAPVDFQTEPEPQRRLGEYVDRLGGDASHILIAFGAFGDQENAEKHLAEARNMIDVNFASAAVWALAAANVIERQGAGALIAIGSHAGDRGLRSNYIYGAAKAGLATLMQGLAHRLAKHRARAVLIKPGPVASPMTAGMDQSGAFWSNPERIAAIIHKSADRGGPTIYAPRYWRWFMLALRAAPAGVVHRMRI